MRSQDTVDFRDRNHRFLLQDPGLALIQTAAAGREKLVEWKRRLHYRNELKRLMRVGPHMIKDVGLTLEEAYHETNKPFWTP